MSPRVTAAFFSVWASEEVGLDLEMHLGRRGVDVGGGGEDGSDNGE